MNPFIMVLLTAVVVTGCASTDSPPVKTQESPAGDLMLWSDKDSKYVGVETFWRQYADTRGGLTWGEGRDYPEYAKVKEFDTFLVEVDQGKCLMEFFHSRWRRANDVRRWHDKVNEYGGCPYVFD